MANDVLGPPRGTGEEPDWRRRHRGIALVAVVVAAVAVIAGVAIPRLFGPALDVYRPDDVAFFEQIEVGGPAAEEAERYESLSAGRAAADAVVVAEVVDVQRTRVIVGEVDTDRVPMFGVVVRPVELVAGKLPNAYADELTVEFMAGDRPDQEVERLRADLPEGRSVWFLRLENDNPEAAEQYYRLISSQGFFVQGEENVVDAVSGVEPRGMAEEGESYGDLSSLVRLLRDP